MTTLATSGYQTAVKGSTQVDIVITAPKDGVPLLFVEIGNSRHGAADANQQAEYQARMREHKEQLLG